MSTDWREQIRERARQQMRRQIEQCVAAGQPLFTDQQVAVIHQRIRDRRAKSV